MANDKIYWYPLWVRIWHWVNALLFIILLLTGISMQYSAPDSNFLISFEKAVQIHNICGIFISISYLFFIIGNAVSSNGKQYRIKSKGLLNRLYKQSIFYMFGMFKSEAPPFPITKNNKFNPLQRFTYTSAMYFGLPILITSGLALLFPEIIFSQLFGVSGILITALFHVIMGFILSLFLITHIYFCTIGKTVTSNFKSMFTGWH